MLVWTLIIILTAIACAALIYAGRARAVNAVPSNVDGVEPARDGLRVGWRAGKPRSKRGFSPLVAGFAVLAIAGLGLGAYALIGRPSLPGSPSAGRTVETAIPKKLASIIEKLEARMAGTLDDVHGWQVLGPVYMRAGRYGDAVTAYRRILTLAGKTPDTETDLAEALSMANGGVPNAEALSLLEEAAAADPRHVRSRFYLANEALQRGDFARAEMLWKEVIALSDGSESWRPAANQALAVAEAGLATGGSSGSRNTLISGMVEGLASRLDSDGGTIAEWTQLVRAFIMLNERERAQKAYDAARTAYPAPDIRSELDTFARQNGLT